jgi:hypothetical protein
VKGCAYLLILALTAAGLLGAAWWWVIARPMDVLDPEYGVWLAKMKMADALQPREVIAVLGDSCATADLIPPLIGSHVINLGLGGGSPIEAYFMARRLLARNHPTAMVVSFVPANLARINRFGAHVTIFDRAMKFGLLDGSQMEEIRRHSRDLGDDSIFGPAAPLDLDARLKISLLAHHFPVYYFGDVLDPNIMYWRRENALTFAETEATRGYYGRHNLTRNTELDANTSLTEFRPPGTVDSYFRQLLGLLESRGIPVYFVSMPISQLSSAATRPEVKEEYVEYLHGLAASYPDFHEPAEALPSMPVSYFNDSIHLATAGAVVWSGRTREVLIKDGLDPGEPDANWHPPSH